VTAKNPRRIKAEFVGWIGCAARGFGLISLFSLVHKSYSLPLTALVTIANESAAHSKLCISNFLHIVKSDSYTDGTRNKDRIKDECSRQTTSRIGCRWEEFPQNLYHSQFLLCKDDFKIER
jgi:hypothetical protein